MSDDLLLPREAVNALCVRAVGVISLLRTHAAGLAMTPAQASDAAAALSAALDYAIARIEAVPPAPIPVAEASDSSFGEYLAEGGSPC